jgi:poly(3-hydroxyalkanoate) synthetase
VNWEALGAIGEVVGAIGVIATLGYLAVQIRQNTTQLSESTKIAQLGAMEANVESSNRIRELIIANADVSELYARGSKSYLDLDSAERVRFSMLIRNMLNATQAGHVRHLVLRNDPADFRGNERMLESMFRQKGIREWLDKNEPDWRPEFSALVRSIVEKIDADTAA